jgi:hypothetical protein
MTFRSSIRITTAAAALAAVLVIAPAASASSNGDTPVPRRSALNGVDPHGRVVASDTQQAVNPSVPIVPDRSDGLGTSQGPLVVTSSIPVVPDRSDGLGTSRGPQVVQVPIAAQSTGGLSWSDGIIAAAFLLGASLLAAFAFMSIRGRGRGGLAIPS